MIAAMTTALKQLSAYKEGDITHFTVWAPEKKRMVLHLVQPYDRLYEMQRDESGYWNASIEGLPAGARYYFQPDRSDDLPDPASRFQPDGVHGPSEVVDPNYNWNDADWINPALDSYIIYELHVGTFTEEGSFEAIIPRLDSLLQTGINAIELLPVAQFPGNRNWGYDGVFPYAVQNSYGGPEGLRKLVDACHNKGLAVILDVVYNHQGPEGNYLTAYAPYFSNRYHTPWGDAINFDWEWSDGVREFYVQNSLYWLKEFHIDALRFDAIHAIFDFSPLHIWEQLHDSVKELEISTGKKYHLIAESDLNDPRALDATSNRGFGFDAQWLDDFHHALYKVLHPQDKERYNDFGSLQQLAKAYKDGFIFDGTVWAAFRKRRFGGPSAGIPGNKFIAFTSNHDQCGNRPDGGRPSMFMDFERIKLNAAALMLSPYIPMLFMGEEYAADTPFYYFVSHSDESLVEAVRKGRKEEFKDSGFSTEPPDAQAETTFAASVLNWGQRKEGRHSIILAWHETLIRIRRELSPLLNFDKKDVHAEVLADQGLQLVRNSQDGETTIIAFFNFSEAELAVRFDGFAGAKKLLDSKEKKWMWEEKSASQCPDKIQPGQSFLVPPLTVVLYLSSRGKNIES